MLIWLQRILAYSFKAVAIIHTPPLSQQFPQSRPAACLTAEPQPASFGPDVGPQANRGLSPPPAPLSTSRSGTVGTICLWHRDRLSIGRRGGDQSRKGGEGRSAVALWWTMNESCKRGTQLRKVERGDRNIWDWDWVRQRKTSGTTGSFFGSLRVSISQEMTLQMLCGIPSSSSQLKLTTKPLAAPRPSELSFRNITAPPWPATPSFLITFDIPLQQGQTSPITALLKRKLLRLRSAERSPSIMCFYESCCVNNVAFKANFHIQISTSC